MSAFGGAGGDQRPGSFLKGEAFPGRRPAEHYGVSIYDAMIAASALHAECDTLWSEDMQDGMVIQERLRIANPFRID